MQKGDSHVTFNSNIGRIECYVNYSGLQCVGRLGILNIMGCK